MMRRLLAIILSACLLTFGVSAALADFAPVAKEDIKVGFIYIGDVVDKGYTYAHHQGTLGMQAALGLSDDQVIIKTNVDEDASCETALRELIEAGCNIIFGNSFGFQGYMEDLAMEYPDVIFSHCSGYLSNDTNFNNYFGAIYEARYLSGIAAGMKTETGKIGFVAAKPFTEVIGGYDAFALGVQSVNPDAVVYVKYTDEWYSPTLERQAAEALLDLGCDVIAQHCDTAMPQIAAQERGVYGVGYNADMTADAPKAHLVAPIWNWDVIVTKEVQDVIDGTWKPENIFLFLKDGLVGLSELSENCAPGTQEAIDEAAAKIISGELEVFSGPLFDNEDNQILDDNGCFVNDMVSFDGTVVAMAGEKITPAFIASNLTFIVKGIELQ